MAQENAFVLLGQWAKQAKRNGLSKEKIDEVIKEATSGEYEHLVETLAKN